MMDSNNKTNIDIREYWQIFWRRKILFIIPFVIAIIGGIVMSIITKPVYESSTVVRVSQGQLLSRAMQRLVPGVTDQERLNNLKKLITSHNYLKRLIETLNLYENPEMRANAEKNKAKFPGMSTNEIVEILWIEQLKKFLSIRQTGSDFVQILAYGTTPEMAYNFARTLSQIFIDESLRREVGGIRGALEFGNEQLSIYKKKLEESEERLRKFKEGVFYENFESRTMLSANVDQLTSTLATIDFELREARDRLSFLQRKINDQNIRYRSPNTQNLRMLKASLDKAAQDLSDLMLNYSWQDAKVIRLNSEIENLQERIRNQIEVELRSDPNIGNDSHRDIILQKEIVATDVSFLETKKNTLANTVNNLKRNLAQGPARELQLSRLTREVEANREVYQTLLQQTQGSEIEEALQRTSAEFKFEIIEPAIKPIKPIQPNRIKIILMAIALGMGVGGGLIFAFEYMDHSFKKVEDIEKYLGLPVLGTLPKIDTEKF